ncbi:lipid-A-disaccharide synthase [Hydrogenophaga pseudoflava]|uniref:lipid-A-disaccharide synthase n=1 Tax=Hydrogenophaga pseudoflava TaxID=47421 RepID=UPI0027E544CC|nr:lipid-A-disaccharide synthase [Hydrogenophaga pseudoflava]MDQ7746534.1 lipid-A-disaccharide synthase [Hydrogenophaga pseudoflava]
MNASRRVALVAGETSGDLLAGLLLQGLRGRWPDLSAVGIGGAAMAKQGFEAWWPSDKLAVRGYVEVLRHYREIAGIRTQLRQRLLWERPDVFIGVDAPDFNLDLEGDLRSADVKTVHFICPSIWAWRPERVEKIRRSADHVLCIFPFEPELLARHGIGATYVGHPIASVIPLVPDRLAARRTLGIDAAGPVVAILPGSRRSEVQYLARRFFDAAVLMRSRRPDLRFVVPAVPALREAIEGHARDAGLQEVLIVQGRSHEVLAACDVTLIASGTATLEAALFKRPMVIAYNMHWLSWIIMRRKQLQPWVGLPNILSGEFVVPELLQDAATPEALAHATLAWLDSPQRVAALEDRFIQLHHLLKRDTARLATDAIEKVLAG